MSYVLCVGISFILQKYFAFRANGSLRFELPRFIFTALLGLILSTLIVIAGLGLGLPAAMCYFIVAVIVAPLSYVLMSQFVFPVPLEKSQ